LNPGQIVIVREFLHQCVLFKISGETLNEDECFFRALLVFDIFPGHLTHNCISDADEEILGQIASKWDEDGSCNKLTNLREIAVLSMDGYSALAARFLLEVRMFKEENRKAWLRAHIKIDESRLKYRQGELQRLRASAEEHPVAISQEDKLQTDLTENQLQVEQFTASIASYTVELAELEARS